MMCSSPSSFSNITPALTSLTSFISFISLLHSLLSFTHFVPSLTPLLSARVYLYFFIKLHGSAKQALYAPHFQPQSFIHLFFKFFTFLRNTWYRQSVQTSAATASNRVKQKNNCMWRWHAGTGMTQAHKAPDTETQSWIQTQSLTRTHTHTLTHGKHTTKWISVAPDKLRKHIPTCSSLVIQLFRQS